MPRNLTYSGMLKNWQKMRDVFQGEEHMKNRALAQNTNNLEGTDELKPLKTFDQYLRPTDSMRRLGDLGLQRFCDYIYRAKFYEFPLEIRNQSLGLIENQEANIELPVQMEGMLEDCTTNEESALKVLSITNTEQLEVSRVGLLLSPSNKDNKPFNIGVYKAEAIIDTVQQKNENYEKALVWVKLLTEDVEPVSKKPIYLILTINESGNYAQYKTTDSSVEYGDEINTDNGYIQDSYIEPQASENYFNEIPFVIINVTRLGSEIERPFLETIADSSISLFRASAHKEDALYWGGESTLFTKGYGIGAAKEEDNRIYVGNGASNKTTAEYADAKYVTMGTDGIQPRQDNETNQFEYCVSLGVDLINKGSESGVALNIRSNVKTASLKTLSLTGALGLQTLLRLGAQWLNLDVKQVIVKANTAFADVVYTAQDFVNFSTLVSGGAMRARDYYNLQKKNNLTTAETFEDWLKELENSETSNNENT